MFCTSKICPRATIDRGYCRRLLQRFTFFPPACTDYLLRSCESVNEFPRKKVSFRFQIRNLIFLNTDIFCYFQLKKQVKTMDRDYETTPSCIDRLMRLVGDFYRNERGLCGTRVEKTFAMSDTVLECVQDILNFCKNAFATKFFIACASEDG